MTEIHEKIVNHGLLTKWLGYWPNFHDFEITRIEMDRSVPSIAIEIYGFHIMDEVDKYEVDEKGFYKVVKKCLITMKFTEPEEMSFSGFNNQNALDKLVFEQKDSFLKVQIHSNNGMGGSILCKNIEVVSVTPIDKPPKIGKGELPFKPAKKTDGKPGGYHTHET
jgi:hypothetical protein